MASDIWEIILTCAESSFIEVTVFVGGILLLFGYINFKQQGDFQQTIERSKKYQPLKIIFWKSVCFLLYCARNVSSVGPTP
jgi:uncharacterized membrane protein YidH (DUF202 family)